MLEVGDRAPAFTLEGIDTNGDEIKQSLSALKGGKVVLYFYPRDSTPGCTTEACDFRDNMARLNKDGVTVIGASPDSTASHLKFRDKQGLNFTLLADPERSVAEAYGAYGEKVLYGKKSMGIIRSTFVIDEKGMIQALWRKVKVKGHVQAVLEAL